MISYSTLATLPNIQICVWYPFTDHPMNSPGANVTQGPVDDVNDTCNRRVLGVWFAHRTNASAMGLAATDGTATNDVPTVPVKLVDVPNMSRVSVCETLAPMDLDASINKQMNKSFFKSFPDYDGNTAVSAEMVACISVNWFASAFAPRTYNRRVPLPVTSNSKHACEQHTVNCPGPT